MIPQALIYLGKTKFGKMLYILILTFTLPSFSQQFDLHSTSLSTPPEVIYIKRYTDSLYKEFSGNMTFVGRVNPMLYTHYYMINGWPSLMDTATLQTVLDSKYNSSNPAGYITSVPAQSWASITSKPTTISGYGITDATPSNRTITINGNTQDLSASRTWTVSSTPTYTFNNNVARTLNSNFTISTTRDAHVSYSISLSCTNPLLAGSSTASVFLEYSTDGGSNWITVANAVNSSSVALAVTIALTQPNTFVVSGVIPANGLVRLRSTTAGTASVVYSRGQEVY